MSTNDKSHFNSYWRRRNMRSLAMQQPAPCITWTASDGLNEVERVIAGQLQGAERILDFGAGDQILKHKLLANGFGGVYETFDISPEFETTHKELATVSGPYDAILCLEVIEHMPLAEGLQLREYLDSLLGPGGRLIVSTPNPNCVMSPFATDETHVHLYPLHDFLAWGLDSGHSVLAYRVRQIPVHDTVYRRMRRVLQRSLCWLLGIDYAHGWLAVLIKPSHREPA